MVQRSRPSRYRFSLKPEWLANMKALVARAELLVLVERVKVAGGVELPRACESEETSCGS